MGEKLGSEFRVNMNTVNDQGEPDVAMNKRGQFVVVWQPWDSRSATSTTSTARFQPERQ